MGKLTPIIGSAKILEITYQTPYENLQATPTPLPTAEPATSQIVYTVAESDLPTLSMNVESKIIVALMCAGGKNTDTASQTVYWRMLKNGSSVRTGNYNVSAGYYWTVNVFFRNVAVGDVLELRLWASSSAVNWDYEARQLQYSRIALLKEYTLSVCDFDALSRQPTLTLGNPYRATANLYVYHVSGAYSWFSATKDFSPWKQHITYNLFRIYYGDYNYANSGAAFSSSTYRPYYTANYVPTRIILRALKEIT